MDTNVIRLLIITVALVVVVIFALVILKERIKRIIIKLFGNILDVQVFQSEDKGLNGQPAKTRSKKALTADSKPSITPALPPEPPHLPVWLFPRWMKISIPVVLIFALIFMPLWCWNRHSEAWKLELSHHISEVWVLVKQGPKEPVHVVQSGRTLQELTRLLDGYADILGRNPHRVIEVWVVDHYWQYWTTDTFNDYTRANRRFVDSGGKIHRMFIFTEDDLKNPRVTTVLRNQCEKIGADVWRSNAAAIRNKAEYQITANAFQQMPYTETGFQSFDVLQLEDLTYYSSDFSPDYRVVGASTWFYGQTLDLKPLFNRSIAQRFDCSSWKTSLAAETVQHP
jgi:hypothetical protein